VIYHFMPGRTEEPKEESAPRDRYQLVWWGWRSWSIGFTRLDPEATDLALIYRWLFYLGPMEIRRWVR
jgi:hypothetical protein